MVATPQPQALILVDLQRSFVEGDTAVPGSARLMAAAAQQLAAARSAGAVVAHVQNDGSAETLDEPDTPGWQMAFSPGDADLVVRKTGDSAFVKTELHQMLQARGVTEVSVCGLLSEMCVAATVRSALDLGYGVVLAHDSHATYAVPGFGEEPGVPAEMAARAAEWSLGDTVRIPATSAEINFRPARTP
jgi:nicotinamidase-related amidase